MSPRAARIAALAGVLLAALGAIGGLALLAGAAFVLLGLALGFDRDTAEGALAIVGVAACGLVVAGVGATMLAG